MRLQYVAWIASDYFELLREENDSKQSDEFQAIQYVEKLQNTTDKNKLRFNHSYTNLVSTKRRLIIRIIFNF